MNTRKKLQIASNLTFISGLCLLLWIDWRIALAIFILGIAKILEEKARDYG